MKIPFNICIEVTHEFTGNPTQELTDFDLIPIQKQSSGVAMEVHIINYINPVLPLFKNCLYIQSILGHFGAHPVTNLF